MHLHDSIVMVFLVYEIVSFTLHYITLHYITIHYITSERPMTFWFVIQKFITYVGNMWVAARRMTNIEQSDHAE